MAALHRALALAERDHGAVLVAEQLDLDVTRPLDVALAEHGAVAERRLRLAPRGLERLGQLRRLADDAHPAPAAARRGLDHQREAELLGLALRHDRHARLARDPLRRELVAARAERLRRGPDEHEARGADGLGEVGALGEEAVAGMDRVGAGLLRGTDVLLGVQVRRDLDGLVRLARVEGATVVGRGHRDRRDPELAAGAEHAGGDLAPIRDQELADRHAGCAGSSRRGSRSANEARQITLRRGRARRRPRGPRSRRRAPSRRAGPAPRPCS